MGNIKSFCCRDGLNTDDDQEERARIVNDHYPSTTSLYDESNNSNQDAISYGSINNDSSKTMEQSALEKIYQKMAANVIDVAPGDSMVIQPAEFLERQKAYQARLNQIKTPLPLRSAGNRVAKHVSGTTIDTRRLNTSVASISGGSSNWAKAGQLNSTNNSNGGQNSTSNTTIANTTGSSNSLQNISKAQEKRRVEYEPISVDDIQLIHEISSRTVQAIKGLKINSREQVITHFQP